MSKKLNALLKGELEKNLSGVGAGVLVNYQGLRSEEAYALRKELHGKKIKMQVLKNSLAGLALKDLGVQGLSLVGPIAICSNDDPVAVAKALVDYRKKNKKTKLEIKGGLLEKQLLTPKQVSDLAALPSRDQLRAQVVGTLAAPMRGLAMAMAGILRKLLYAVNAVKESQEKSGGAAAPAA